MQTLDSKQLDKAQEYLGPQTVPEMLFGHNRLYIVNQEKNFVYYFSPFESLKLCSYQEQKKRLLKNIVELKEEAAPGVDDS